MKTHLLVFVLLFATAVMNSADLTTAELIRQWRVANPADQRTDEAVTLELGRTRHDLLSDPKFYADYEKAEALDYDAIWKESDRENKLHLTIFIVIVVAILSGVAAFLRKPVTRRARSQQLVLCVGVLFFILSLCKAPWRLQKRAPYGSTINTTIEHGPLWSPPYGNASLDYGTLAVEWLAIGVLTGVGAFALRKRAASPMTTAD